MRRETKKQTKVLSYTFIACHFVLGLFYM